MCPKLKNVRNKYQHVNEMKIKEIFVSKDPAQLQMLANMISDLASELNDFVV